MHLLRDKDIRRFLFSLAFVLFLGILFVQIVTYLDAQKVKKHIITHDYELAGYLKKAFSEMENTNLEAGNGDLLIDSAVSAVFTSEKTPQDLELGQGLLEQYGYKDSIVLQLTPRVNDYYKRNALNNLVYSLALSALVLLIVFLFLRNHYRVIGAYKEDIEQILKGDVSIRLNDTEEGQLQQLASSINLLTTSLHTHIERELQNRVFLKDMITNVSHQLKTPLAALSMYTEIMKDESGNNKAVLDFLSKSQSELNRMQNLIANLLKLARFDAGSIELNKNEVVLNDIIKEVAESFETRVSREGKDLQVIAEEKVSYSCDREWLREALSNLLKNALEHTEKGNYIRVLLEKTPVIVKITVEDNGTGIHPEDINHIFKRFYRSRFSQDKQGTGVGLTLAKTIVEMHEGFISVDSSFGKGTRFTIHLPTLQNCKL